MWIGEIISEKKIGNGISLLIFAGIIAAIPTQIRQFFLLNFDPSMVPTGDRVPCRRGDCNRGRRVY